MSGRDRSWHQWRELLSDEPLPAAICDLDALEHNLSIILERMGSGSLTLRPATKSIRVPALLRHVAERAAGRAPGLMTFSARETALLAAQGYDDLLLAYPVGRPAEARALCEQVASGRTIYATVDSAEQVAMVAAEAKALGVTLPLCMDIDMSWRLLGMHLGVRRSPVRSAEDARRLGRVIGDTPCVALRAVLAYEAQVAAIRPRNPGSRHMDPIRRLIRGRSIPLVAARRAEVVAALRADGHALSVVNGGGTGSIRSTSRDPSVSEVTAGSGFFCPHLFDHYAGLPLVPAAFFALAVVRRSDPDHVTCAGGGYVASGAVGADRAPVIHAPAHLKTVELEGFGEVQTPLVLESGAPTMALGDPVICRHAKAGELAERFNDVLLVRGESIVDRVPTYRGLGAAFM